MSVDVALATIAGVVLSFAVVFAGYIRRSVKGSVDNLAAVLTERLATKDAVAGLMTRVAVLETKINSRR